MKSLFLSVLAIISVVALRAEPAKAKAKEAGCECELVDAYVPIAKALAADDLKAARAAAVELVKQADADGMTGIVAHAKVIARAKDLAAARAEFKPLSAEIVPLVDDDDVVVMTCPMAKADWVQAKGPTANPYYGRA